MGATRGGAGERSAGARGGGAEKADPAAGDAQRGSLDRLRARGYPLAQPRPVSHGHGVPASGPRLINSTRARIQPGQPSRKTPTTRGSNSPTCRSRNRVPAPSRASMNVTFDGGLLTSTARDQTMRRVGSNSITSASTHSSVCLFIRNRQPTAGLKSLVAINQAEMALLSVISAHTISIAYGNCSSNATSSFTRAFRIFGSDGG